MTADLHMHSVFSDGSFRPEELVRKAVEVGLDTIALADHDTVEGLPYAEDEAEKVGLEFIPAIEFSTFMGKAEIHMLGYFIDYHSQLLQVKINEIFKARIERAKKMIELLNKTGIDITFAEVARLAGDKYVGRPHIARAMVEKGYINNMGEAFTLEYIGNGGKAYVSKYIITPVEAIDLIKKAGGIPVLGHPYFINHGKPFGREDIEKLIEKGLAGIEVYHSKHPREACEFYLKIADDLGLLVTGGTDFHGENSPGVHLGDITIEDYRVARLREHRQRK